MFVPRQLLSSLLMLFTCAPRPRLLRFSCASCVVVHERSPQALPCVQRVQALQLRSSYFYTCISYGLMTLLSVQNTQTKTTYFDCNFRCWALTSVWKASEVLDSAKQFGLMKEKRNQGERCTKVCFSKHINESFQVHKLQDAWAEESQECTNL